MILRTARVLDIVRRSPEFIEIRTEIVNAPVDSEVLLPGETVTAAAYTLLVGDIRVGDKVQIEASAIVKRLGTGGFAFVTAKLNELPSDILPNPGHLMKARYTPLQVTVLGAEEPDSPHYERLQDAQDLANIPVVCADLHSALPAIAVGIRAQSPKARIVYLHTDGGALPVALSNLVRQAKANGLIDVVISVGQSYGGDLESVNVYSGLLAARHAADADVVIVCQGPGNLGTASTWGYSGIAVGEHLNAATVLAGSPIAALRQSNADPRNRHRGISHHTLTALTRITSAPVTVALPEYDGNSEAEEALRGDLDFNRRVREGTSAIHAAGNHIKKISTAGLYEELERCPVPLSTMGRGLSADPAAFLAAAVAGKYAGNLQTTSS